MAMAGVDDHGLGGNGVVAGQALAEGGKKLVADRADPADGNGVDRHEHPAAPLLLEEEDLRHRRIVHLLGAGIGDVDHRRAGPQFGPGKRCRGDGREDRTQQHTRDHPPIPPQPPMPHCGRPQPPGSGEAFPLPPATCPATTLSRLSSFRLWQWGHSGVSSPRMSSSKLWSHFRQTYSKRGMTRFAPGC